MSKDLKNMLVQSTIEKICKYYSNNENVSGVLKVVKMNDLGVENIKLIIIYNKLIVEPNYFGFNDGRDKSYIGDDVTLLIETREDIEFGLLGRYFFEKGQPSAYSFLVDGEIIYDRTGKYNELKKNIKRDNRVLKRISTNRSTGVAVRS